MPHSRRWAALGLALASACQAPPPPLQAASPEPATATAERTSGEIRRPSPAPGTLRVRLTELAGVLSFEVGGSDRGALRLSRRGDLVESSAGESAPHVRLVPARGAKGLTVGERTYPGELWIEVDEHSGLVVENVVDLEDYVAGVVPTELILWSAKEAEIEAQAICARSYALRSLQRRGLFERSAFLWDDTRDQVYGGRFRLGDSRGERAVEARLARALELSRGQVLVDDRGAPYDVRFHASCGGTTTSPAGAFPLESDQHHAPVPCAPCREIGAEERRWPRDDPRRRRVHWRWTAPAEELARLARTLGLGERLASLGEPRADAHGRWQSVRLDGPRGTTRLSVERLRGELGAGDLKSGRVLDTWPDLGAPLTGGMHFEGLGRGHGAGLCQVGSHELAVAGWSARQILAHYLPGSRVVPLEASP